MLTTKTSKMEDTFEQECNVRIAEFMGVPSTKFGSIRKWMAQDESKQDLRYPENLSFDNELCYRNSIAKLSEVVRYIMATPVTMKDFQDDDLLQMRIRTINSMSKYIVENNTAELFATICTYINITPSNL
jgi:hypothetical protein